MPITRTIDAPGAVIHYDVREADSAEPPLLVFGSPMEASAFGALADNITGRTVVTYDPRGANRSKRTDDAEQTMTAEHVDDIRRVISDLGGGAVDIFATSGGAVNALALVERHPELVRTLVAHEPPAITALPDGEHVRAVCRDIRETYLRSGEGPAMAKFIALVMHQGEIGAGYLDQPAPDPAQFGLPTEDDGSRDHPLVGQNIVTGNSHEFDFDALRAAPTRILLAVGTDSGDELAARGARAVAERLGDATVPLPGGHAGFTSPDLGMGGDPAGFAARLREVLGG